LTELDRKIEAYIHILFVIWGILSETLKNDKCIYFEICLTVIAMSLCHDVFVHAIRFYLICFFLYFASYLIFLNSLICILLAYLQFISINDICYLPLCTAVVYAVTYISDVITSLQSFGLLPTS